jgi:hypothetical protein
VESENQTKQKYYKTQRAMVKYDISQGKKMWNEPLKPILVQNQLVQYCKILSRARPLPYFSSSNKFYQKERKPISFSRQPEGVANNIAFPLCSRVIQKKYKC